MGISKAACGCAQKSARVQPTAHVYLRFGSSLYSGKTGEGLYTPCPPESFLGAYIPNPRTLFVSSHVLVGLLGGGGAGGEGQRAYSPEFCISHGVRDLCALLVVCTCV